MNSLYVMAASRNDVLWLAHCLGTHRSKSKDGKAPAHKRKEVNSDDERGAKRHKEEDGTGCVMAVSSWRLMGDGEAVLRLRVNGHKGNVPAVVFEMRQAGAQTVSAVICTRATNGMSEQAMLSLPYEARVQLFRDLLRDKDVSAFSTWEKEQARLGVRICH